MFFKIEIFKKAFTEQPRWLLLALENIWLNLSERSQLIEKSAELSYSWARKKHTELVKTHEN